MNHISKIYILILLSLFSCSSDPEETTFINLNNEDKFNSISPEIKDSLIQIEKSSQISFPLAISSALENEDNQTLEWILTHGTTQDFEKMLHNERQVEFKAIGIKGLVRSKNKDLFKHLNYSFTQNINLQFGLTCQKLGGYYLYQLDYSISDESSPYFLKEEIEKINKVVSSRNFGCDYK